MLNDDKTIRNFVIKKDLLEELQKEKEKTGLSMSAIMNIAVKEYLDKSKKQNKKAPK